MRVQSLFYENFEHHAVEVEVTLHPGLPGVQILGLPDAVVKDCVWRLKSAFLQSGFQWPTSSQIIVNLRPSNLRKRGAGLDLAIAAALLWETAQANPLENRAELPLLYGEIDLLGDVHTPPDFIHYHPKSEVRLTGKLTQGLPFDTLSIANLKTLGEPTSVPACFALPEVRRPSIPPICFSEKISEVMKIIAAGEHPTLFAGKAGSGKTTVAQAIHTLLEKPTHLATQEFSRYHVHNPISWRPLRHPHHTTPCLSMIGGGVSAIPGELTRAHGGTLIMDEFLEFEASVQEALREPMERGVIELIRCAHARTLPARFLLLATTNLCKCGAFEPGNEKKCECGQSRRRRYLDRLSGPILDRFALVVFSNMWQGRKTVKLKDLLAPVSEAIEFRLARGQEVPNCDLLVNDLKKQLDTSAKAYFFDEDWVSVRRTQHLLRVARTIADLNKEARIHLEHLEVARGLTMQGHSHLKRSNQEMPILKNGLP